MHTPPYQPDFSALEASQRRAMHYALRLALVYPNEVIRGSVHLRAEGIVWQLLLPLFDADALSGWLRGVVPAGSASRLAAGEDPVEVIARDELDEQILKLARRTPPAVLARLAEADGVGPLNPGILVLAEALALQDLELQVLDFIDQVHANSLRLLLRQFRGTTAQENRRRLAVALGVGEAALRRALNPQAALCRLGLVDYHLESDLEDFVQPTSLLKTILDDAPADAEALLDRLIEPAPAAAWGLRDFPHLASVDTQVGTPLEQAARRGLAGVNALFHGAPGTGKTELARALAAARGLRAYQVRDTAEDGDGLERQGRLAAYLLAQRLLARRRDTLLIFDEVEDVLPFTNALWDPEPVRQKGWMNRILEENPVPAIWITNRTAGLDPAYLRRFLLPVACVTPPRSVRRQMAERHLGAAGIPPALLDELAADAALTPAVLGAAGRLVDLRPDTPPARVVREVVGSLRALLHGQATPWQRPMTTAFDVAFLNLAGDISPSAIVQALDRRGRGTLCFHGTPGTGKTAFAEVLAEALDRELVARQASDLISPYVGETERNLARLFQEADPRHTVLLLDEVDSFLADRRQARHPWERTQVNELLQQMERYPGIFVAATNLMSGLDGAAMRRFDFKLHFRALNPRQRQLLFARAALGDQEAPVPVDIARQLAALEQLTPGDFANVCRQRDLLGETLSAREFLRRLMQEYRYKANAVA